jgi:hypothetical protein
MTDQSTDVIYHLFADYGVESEALDRYGEVYRYTVDPKSNHAVSETVQMDLMEETPPEGASLAVCHPRCTDESDMTSIDGDPADHENQIPRAREIVRRVADHYIIENKPRDDLRNPTVLNGRMFGLPIKYERAFETSFPVVSPPRERELPTKTVSPYFYSDRSVEWWQSVKGYTGNYPKQHLAKNVLPAAYVDCLCRSWLRAVNERDAKEPQDNNGRPPRELPDDQASLTTITDGGNRSLNPVTDQNENADR